MKGKHEAMNPTCRDSRPKKRGDAGVYERGHEQDWRIVIGNIGTFPNEGTGHGKMKLDTLKHLYTSSDADLILLNEHNLNLRGIPQERRPEALMKEWQHNSLGQFTQFQDERKDQEQIYNNREYGGTGIITNGVATAHRIDYGEDSRKMGRWNWNTFKGKNEQRTTVISVYRPEKTQSIYASQLAKIRRTGFLEISAEEVWLNDLRKLIREKTKEGNEIIVAGDFNDNLNNNESKINKFMDECGMREILITRYGDGPPTHQRGSTTIDGIYATEGIEAVQGGYFSELDSPGDHRFLWVDISQQDIIGQPQFIKPPQVQRRATTKIPSVKEKFGNIFESQVKKHYLHDKTEELYKSAVKNKSLTSAECEEYERIEERVKRGIKMADANCRKIRKGAVPFSAKAQEIRGAVEIKKLILRRILLRGQPNRPKSTKVKRLARKYKYKGPINFRNKDEAIASLRESYNAYNKFRPKAHEFRDTYLGRIAMELEQKDGTSAEVHFKRLRQQERQKEQARRVKINEGRAVKSGVKKVDIQLEDGTMKTLHDKDDIEKAIIRANTAKRQQANNTPLREEPLRSLLGEQMDFDRWNEILLGQVQLPQEGIEEGTRLWYDYITKQEEIAPLDLSWTTEEYFDSWNKMQETKSCLPGVHTVHIKCINPKSKGADVISKLALIPLLTGYTPKSWKQGIDSMIPKKAEGEHRPEKLRLILLMCARFNHNNKLIGKKMMEYGEKYGTLAEEQYGSRKEKSAIEHALNKRLIIDVARQTKKDCVYIANDAKSCYDRILMLVAYLAMVKHGIDPLAAKSCIVGILEMEMSIRTTHGDSKRKYGGKRWKLCPHGCGQGNGYGPAIWACISSPLLTILKKKGHGVRISSPLTRSIFRFSAISFVDDTDTIEMANDNETWEELIERAQRGLDLWESLLRTTGGALEPSKSDWVKIRHVWKDGKTTLDNRKEDTPLTVRNPAGRRENLKQMKANEARETLGVWQTPNGSEKIQVTKLHGKIKKWKDNIQRSTINRRNAKWASKTTIGKSIRYPLAATTMNDKQCSSLESKFTQAVYGKIGVVRTAPKQLGAAPTHLGGLGLNSNIHENQTIDHIAMLMKHGHKQTATGKLIRASAETFSLESGLPGDPFQLQAEKIKWTTDNTWVQNSIKSMEKYDLKLSSGISGLKMWATHDGFIMHEASKILKDIKAISRFNKVRMYLRVATLSDLLTADGKKISYDIYQVSKYRNCTSPSTHAYSWPAIPEPTHTEKELWQTTIKIIMGVTRATLETDQDTGFAWDEQCKNLAGWNVTSCASTLYQKLNGNAWKEWKRVHTRTRNIIYSNQGQELSKLPEDTHPCSVTIEDNNAIITNIGDYSELEGDEEDHHTTGWILPRIAGNNYEEQIFINNISKGQGQIVSDGSCKEGRSTSAFVVLPNKNIHGSNTVPGEPQDQNSYRGELGGILSSICYTNKICTNHNISEGLCTMYCDNKGALSAAFGWKHPNPRWASYDLVCLIRYHLSQSPIKWKAQHIRGHQDKNTAYEELDIIAQGNVDADRYAAIEMEVNRPVDQRVIIGAPWELKQNGKRIVGDIEKRIRNTIHEREMQEYWRKKFSITKEQQDQVNWEVFKKVNRMNEDWVQTWMTKYNSRIGGVRKNMHRRKHATDDKCPCCEEQEDTDHLLKCKNKDIQEVYDEKMKEIKEWMKKNTSAEMTKGVVAVIEAFRNGTDLDLEGCNDNMVKAAAKQQFELGQRAFVGGWWSRRWTTLQHIYYREQGKKNKASIWIARLIIQIQDMIRNMWFERNIQLHNKEQSQHNERTHQQLNMRITKVYERLNKAAPNKRILNGDERYYFSRKENEIKRKRIRSKNRWVKEAEDIIEILEIKLKRHNSIRDYLTYAAKEYG